MSEIMTATDRPDNIVFVMIREHEAASGEGIVLVEKTLVIKLRRNIIERIEIGEHQQEEYYFDFEEVELEIPFIDDAREYVEDHFDELFERGVNEHGSKSITSVVCKPQGPPQKPDLEKFTDPKPHFTSHLETVEMKTACFGLDDSRFFLKVPHDECFWISEKIDISDFELIRFFADDYKHEFSAIEYYLVFNDQDPINVFPENQERVVSEKISIGGTTRFAVDERQPIFINKNLLRTSESLMQIFNNGEEGALYTVTYSPKKNKDNFSFDLEKPQSEDVKNTVRVMVKMHLYDKQKTEPYVNRIYFRGHEGEITWKQVI